MNFGHPSKSLLQVFYFISNTFDTIICTNSYDEPFDSIDASEILASVFSSYIQILFSTEAND